MKSFVAVAASYKTVMSAYISSLTYSNVSNSIYKSCHRPWKPKGPVLLCRYRYTILTRTDKTVHVSYTKPDETWPIFV